MIAPLRDGAPAERAERIAGYLLERVRQRSPHTWRQARRRESEAEVSSNGQAAPVPGGTPHLEIFRTFHIARISELAQGGLRLVELGFPVLLGEAPLAAAELLALQAQGARCVTLLRPGEAPPPPHVDALDFVLHDLCHLAKFADAEHHAGQIGFFTTLSRAFAEPRWQSTEARLDDGWRADRAAVSADMNGSCVFLMAVLKMRLKMAARRSLSRSRGVPAPTAGPATPEEELEFAELFGALLDAMGLPDDVRAAAVATNARRDDVLNARCLLAHFDAIGRARGGFQLPSLGWFC